MRRGEVTHDERRVYLLTDVLGVLFGILLAAWKGTVVAWCADPCVAHRMKAGDFRMQHYQ
jgi:hypothetical protein